MVLLDGELFKRKKLEELKNNISKIDRKLGIAIIVVGSDRASFIYARKKQQLAEEIGYNCIFKCFNDDIDEDILIDYIHELNGDNSIDGIMVELPLSNKFNRDRVIDSIDYRKDIDGLTSINRKYLESGKPYLIPCTAKGIIDLLGDYNIDISKLKINIIGKSILVGKPLCNIFNNNKYQVTLLDSKVKDLVSYTKNADLIIIAIGKAKYLNSSMIKRNTIIIDVGINYLDGKICGDVDYDDVLDKVSYITPVPHGIGPVTLYEAMNNVYLAYLLKIGGSYGREG